MATKLVVKGVPPYDGEYDFDASYFTMRELHVIKRVAGVRAGELEEALAAGDLDVVVALAAIALERAGVNVDEEVLWSSRSGQIEITGEADEPDDASPPVVASAPTSSGGSLK